MRVFVGMLCCTMMAAASFAQDGNEGKGPNKDVEVKVTFPKEIEFTKADKAGGKVAELKIKVEVKNKSDAAIVLSSAQYDVKLPKLMGSVKKSIDAFQLEAGKTAQQDKVVTFHTILPKNGEEVIVEFYVYGHKHVGKLKAKVME